MAHFAKIEDGNVTEVIVVANAVLDTSGYRVLIRDNGS